VGCLGGLGRSLTAWMLDRGCRDFVFCSRSGTAKPEAAEVVAQLEQSGARVRVFCIDASDDDAVAAVVAEVTSSGTPIKGVVHAAMVLRDGLFQAMSLDAYRAALDPKMRAAAALHRALLRSEAPPLDFFLMTSSLSAVLGNPGQSNYCAGNSYLDSLARHRVSRGLPACSLALPMVEDVGVVAENAAIAQSLARRNPFGVDEREMLQAFEAAIVAQQLQHNNNNNNNNNSGGEEGGAAQIVLGLEPEAIVAAMDGADLSSDTYYWARDPRLSLVREELGAVLAASSGTGGEGGGGQDRHGSGGFVATLAGKPEAEMLQDISAHIVARTARILGMQPEQFAVEDASVASQGIDSMIGVELQSWLFREFGLRVSIGVISNPNTTFAELARSAAHASGLLE
jgi:hypothetical protein